MQFVLQTFTFHTILGCIPYSSKTNTCDQSPLIFSSCLFSDKTIPQGKTAKSGEINHSKLPYSPQECN